MQGEEYGWTPDTDNYLPDNGVSIVLLTLFVLGCQNASLEKKYSANEFESVGELHNEGLNFILADLKANSTKKLTARSDGKYTLKEFLVANQESGIRFAEQQMPDMTAEEKKFLKQTVSKVSHHFDNFLDKALAKQKGGRVSFDDSDLFNIRQSMIDEASLYLSPNQLTLVNQLFYAMDSSTDANSLTQMLNSVENQVYSLPQSEQPAILGAISIARSSSQYWEENLSTWNETITEIIYYNSSGQPIIARVQWMIAATVGIDVAAGLGLAVVCWGVGPIGGLFAVKLVSARATVASSASYGLFRTI